jgi:hypothetical protein
MHANVRRTVVNSLPSCADLTAEVGQRAAGAPRQRRKLSAAAGQAAELRRARP